MRSNPRGDWTSQDFSKCSKQQASHAAWMCASIQFTVVPNYDNITRSNNTHRTYYCCLTQSLCSRCRDRWLSDLCADERFNRHAVKPLGRVLQCNLISPHSRSGIPMRVRYRNPRGMDRLNKVASKLSMALLLISSDLNVNLTFLGQSPPNNHLDTGLYAKALCNIKLLWV